MIGQAMLAYDMFRGVSAPTPSEMRAFDAEWAGQAHHNVCVEIKSGRATFKVVGTPDFVWYYAPPEADLDAVERPGQIEVSPAGPADAVDGTVCFGIAGK